MPSTRVIHCVQTLQEDYESQKQTLKKELTARAQLYVEKAALDKRISLLQHELQGEKDTIEKLENLRTKDAE